MVTVVLECKWAVAGGAAAGALIAGIVAKLAGVANSSGYILTSTMGAFTGALISLLITDTCRACR
ncbi:MAG: hypothetical protein QW587_04760 [Candidatus Bathyarchaeia archaeon]